MDADEAARNDPPLCALSKHTGRAPAPARAAHVNNKALPPRGLNPSTLADWPEDGTPDPATGRGPLEAAFVGAFSFREKIMSQQPHGKPSPADDPMYHVKESMVVMARHCDKFRGKEPIPRISLQDEAQSELIFIDVIGVKVIPGPADHVTGERDVVPAIVVRYSYFTASNRQAMMDSFSGMVAMKVQHDVAMGYTREASERSVSHGANMPSHKAEIATARSILDSSRQRLHPEWVRRESEGLAPNWSVSVLLPVTKEAEEPAPEKEVCAGCGASAGVKLLSCARCKTQRYCSKECQVACWKVHKKVCVAPEDAHANLLMVVDLEVDVMASLGLPGMHSWSINHDASTGNKKNFMVGGGKSKKGAPQDDGMFVVKIQVPLAGGASMGLMCYNQKRNIHTYILTANCAGAQRLASIIRTGGVAGGMKGYFNAYTIDAGKKLCILAGKPLPLQPW